MKKALLFILFTSVLLLSFCIMSYASTSAYIAPRRDVPPVINGYGTDSAWKDALVIVLSPEETPKNGGWVSNTRLCKASAEIRIVWSNTIGKEGLYFLWSVTDPSQSIASLQNSSDINLQDCVQVLIDPMYKRFGNIKDCALCYTFAPYTSTTGTSIFPNGGPSWWEYWYKDAGMIKAMGIEMGIRTTTNESGLITSYTIEAYIPNRALEINGVYPKKINEYDTTVGIGFTLIDYGFDREILSESGYNASKQYLGTISDFGTSVKSITNPSLYATLYFGDSEHPGTIITNAVTSVEVTSGVSADVSRTRIEYVLNSASNLSADDFLTNSWEKMMKAYTTARITNLNVESTQEQLDTAAENLLSELSDLKRVDKANDLDLVSSERALEYYRATVYISILIGTLGIVAIIITIIKRKHSDK